MSWRDLPPTPKQRALLRRWGWSVPHTRGEASDLIGTRLGDRWPAHVTINNVYVQVVHNHPALPVGPATAKGHAAPVLREDSQSPRRRSLGMVWVLVILVVVLVLLRQQLEQLVPVVVQSIHGLCTSIHG